MASGLLSLKWNNHRSTFFHVLSSIRSKESYCDATLACDGRFYPVHKLVLSTCSEYFEQIFDRTQCKHPVIVLKDIRHEELEALMNYMYIGEVNVLQEKLSGLIKAAECLKVKGLAVPDEDPSSFKENRRKQHRPDNESPHAKRKKREEQLSSDQKIRIYSNHEMHMPQAEQLLENHSANVKVTSPNRSNSSEDKLYNENSYPKASLESTNITSSLYVNEDSVERLSMKQLSETTNEERSVKTEPPDIIIPEEVDIKENLTVLDYNASEEGNSIPADDIDNGHDGNDSDYSNSVNEPGSQNIEEVTSQVLPSSSSILGNSYSMWDAEGSSQNFNSEDFSGENDESRSLVQCDLEEDVLENSYPIRFHFCPFCSYRSTQKANVRNHVRTHTGEKPFLCIRCEMSFNVRSNLRRHMRTRHPQQL